MRLPLQPWLSALIIEKVWCLYCLGLQGRAWVEKNRWNGMTPLKGRHFYLVNGWCFGGWSFGTSFGVSFELAWLAKISELKVLVLLVLLTSLFSISKFTFLLGGHPGQTKGKVSCLARWDARDIVGLCQAWAVSPTCCMWRGAWTAPLVLGSVMPKCA